MKVHEFSSSGVAYDASQSWEEVATGDTMVVPSEGVVGIADTWPVAITVAKGRLHSPVTGYDPAQFMAEAGWTYEQLGVAIAEATRRGYPVSRFFLDVMFPKRPAAESRTKRVVIDGIIPRPVRSWFEER